ncbi:hypothetical protein [Reyranella sp.]|uniref:hypothetical protein n=1 Tax=Reyranella sp. TaxID=1929291 RepID=UPI003D0F54C9
MAFVVASDRGQQGEWFVARPRRQRIADPDRVEAPSPGLLGQRLQRAGFRIAFMTRSRVGRR